MDPLIKSELQRARSVNEPCVLAAELVPSRSRAERQPSRRLRRLYFSSCSSQSWRYARLGSETSLSGCLQQSGWEPVPGLSIDESISVQRREA